MVKDRKTKRDRKCSGFDLHVWNTCAGLHMLMLWNDHETLQPGTVPGLNAKHPGMQAYIFPNLAFSVAQR